MQPSQPPLPIDTVRAELLEALADQPSAVLVAPPGAGKTTRVPLWLLDAEWLSGARILVLEPRRLAARGASERMAHTLGERVGERIGLRARLASNVGPRTRIEVVTEGVFTRMIIDDPELTGIGAVLFDEFHERSLDADLGLALALDAQRALRPDLRILVMSATLDHRRVASLLANEPPGEAPTIVSEGRTFPVETRYLGRDATARIEDQIVSAIQRALDEETGSVLAFLPGQAEIRRVAERLETRIGSRPGIDLAPLYGALDMAEQDRAVAPSPPGRRKVVLATAIAETSLTIEGVRVVVDSGLSRVPRYEPGSGLTRLATVRVSRAAADQRRGRAGRLEPGVCYRLWADPETQSLPAYAEPEIRSADLSGLLLDCAAWGVTDPATLAWLDPPPAAALAAACTELVASGAIDTEGNLTARGRHASRLPLPPRLAMMLLQAAEQGAEDAAADIAAVLVERGLGGNDSDLSLRLSAFRADRGRRANDMRRLARNWARSAAGMIGKPAAGPAHFGPAAILALAFPDRIAKSRDNTGQYLLANGRGARLGDGDPLARAEFLVIAEMTGTAASARISLAGELHPSELDAIAGDRIETSDGVAFDALARQVRSRRVKRLGAIVMSSEPRKLEPGHAAEKALCEGIVCLGLACLPWNKAHDQLRDRVAFLRTKAPETWPDLSVEALAASADDWLLPFLVGKTAVSDISADELGFALDRLLPGDGRALLDEEAPTHFVAPTGNRFAIDYAAPGGPQASIRVQELFGIATHPTIGRQRIPLTFELLSPAHRPIQITRDLPGFWGGSWRDVRADLRGRYPKHEWPQDPASASPTARAKPRPR
jgi:ATP-dependent helicase HrpB